MIKNLFKRIRPVHSKLLRCFAKKDDFYATLGVNKAATQGEIKKAFARLARQYHPDKNPSPEAKEKFSKITEAYDTLSDEKKRQVYDQYGMTGDEQKQYENAGFNPGGPGGPGGFDFSDFFRAQGSAGENPYENIFRDFQDIFGFEGGSRAKRPQRGADIIIVLELDFLEAINGVSKEVSFRIKDTCPTCAGSKCKPGTSPTPCASCHGAGTTSYRQGPMVIQMPCNSCQGSGSTISSPCSGCKGSGVSTITFKQTVSVPKGIDNEQNLRVAGKGNKGENGGVHGDLIIKIAVRPDPYFKREGYDILTEVPISISQAVLGGRLEVRTLTGKQTITVLPGTNHGAKVKLQGMGVTHLPPNQGKKGDHLVVLSVQIPKTLSPAEKQIFEQLKAIEKEPAKTTDKNEQGMKKQNSEKSEGKEEVKSGFFKDFESFFRKNN